MFTIDAHNVRNVTFETKQYNSTNWTTLNVETLDANNNIVVLRVNLFHPPGELVLDASAFKGAVILPPEDAEITPTPTPARYTREIIETWAREIKKKFLRGETLTHAEEQLYENVLFVSDTDNVDWSKDELVPNVK